MAEVTEEVLKVRLHGRDVLTNEQVDSYCLYVNDRRGRHILLSHATQFLLQKGKQSRHTANTYAENLKRFFGWLLRQEAYSQYFWADCNAEMLKRWQVSRVDARIMSGKASPSDQTINREACFVLDFLFWAKGQGISTAVSPKNKLVGSAILDFRDNDFLAHVTKKRREVMDSSDIKISRSRNVKRPNVIDLLDADSMKLFLGGIPDEVYRLIFATSLATGLRREELVQIPYIGHGKNAHVRPAGQIKWDSLGFFKIHVVGKGRKARGVNISNSDWEHISAMYSPIFYERRALYEEKYGRKLDPSVLWLSKSGEPISAKMISNAMDYARKKTGIDCSIHQARHWYATTFVIRGLGNKLHGKVAYNAALDENLRNQLGHASIKTTFQIYINTARFYLSLNNKYINDIYGESGFIVGTLLNEC